jgi:hypothetical protein
MPGAFGKLRAALLVLPEVGVGSPERRVAQCELAGLVEVRGNVQDALQVPLVSGPPFLKSMGRSCPISQAEQEIWSLFGSRI